MARSVALEIIPVLDVMGGLVVHAVAGAREEYRPIRGSAISPSPNPVDVLRGLLRLGCRRVYVADIDAIEGRGNNWWVIERALEMGFSVYADVGREGLLRRDLHNLAYVIGTEYLLYPEELTSVRGRVMSLDLYGSEALFKNTRVGLDEALRSLKGLDPLRVLVIDLSRVGTGRGLNLEAVAKVAAALPGRVVAGGGLASVGELEALRSLGVVGVLVATALHRGVLRGCEDVRNASPS